MTPQELIDKFSAFNQGLKDGLDELQVAALFSLLAATKVRIFNNGEDEEGKSLGGYSTAWAKVRENNDPSLQTAVKKLQFNGDFAKDLQVGTSEGVNVMGFGRDISRLIILGASDYLGVKIIGPSKEEQENLDKIMIEGMDELVLQYI
jgi:hypothetical protein